MVYRLVSLVENCHHFKYQLLNREHQQTILEYHYNIISKALAEMKTSFSHQLVLKMADFSLLLLHMRRVYNNGCLLYTSPSPRDS